MAGGLCDADHRPISSFHKSGFSSIKERISAMHSGWSSTCKLTERCRSKSSAPMKFRFSPTTTREIPNRRLVPLHMMQGLSVLTSVRSGQSRRRPALRMQTTSACAVGSPVCTRKLWPRATIFPAASASTEPMGIPPAYLGGLRATRLVSIPAEPSDISASFDRTSRKRF